MTQAPKILVIEDEDDLARVVRYNLAQAGYEVLVASRARDGLRLAREARPVAVLLDLMLPDGSGLEVCRALKTDAATRAIPVIIMTARGEEVDRVVGFELGADDYVVKPFSVRELVLRVRAVLRRGESVPPTPDPSAVRLGRLEIDPAAHRAFVDGAEVVLTALEFKLLRLLAERRGRVQNREALLSSVWGIDAPIETRTVDTHIKRLREKLGAAGVYIETVRGVGYRFSETPGGPE